LSINKIKVDIEWCQENSERKAEKKVKLKNNSKEKREDRQKRT
jgi:hypothetical protein